MTLDVFFVVIQIDMISLLPVIFFLLLSILFSAAIFCLRCALFRIRVHKYVERRDIEIVNKLELPAKHIQQTVDHTSSDDVIRFVFLF